MMKYLCCECGGEKYYVESRRYKMWKLYALRMAAELAWASTDCFYHRVIFNRANCLKTAIALAQ